MPLALIDTHAPQPPGAVPICYVCGGVPMVWRKGEFLCPLCGLRDVVVEARAPQDLAPRHAVQEPSGPPLISLWTRDARVRGGHAAAEARRAARRR